MARSDRLFRLLQALRTLPSPVTAARLAEETGVSLRSLYRDIDSLRAAGAIIDGERGFGYRLTEDIALPPQTFTPLEIEALVLGLAEVQHMGEPALAAAASALLSKVTATLPDRLQRQALHAASQVYRFDRRDPPAVDVGLLREACWKERVVVIRYVDAGQKQTDRQILPLAIVYLERVFGTPCLVLSQARLPKIPCRPYRRYPDDGGELPPPPGSDAQGLCRASEHWCTGIVADDPERQIDKGAMRFVSPQAASGLLFAVVP